jgi:hypothetical protein
MNTEETVSYFKLLENLKKTDPAATLPVDDKNSATTKEGIGNSKSISQIVVSLR